MARRFLIQPDLIEIPPASHFRERWSLVPDNAARVAIAIEEQYLYFHEHILLNLKHQIPDQSMAPIELGLSVRAGAVKSAILICASIAEAALRAHSEARKYNLKQDPARRTFGNVLFSWQEQDQSPKQEVAGIWDKLQKLHCARNNIHLYKAADEGNNFYALLREEKQALSDAKAALETIRHIKST